MKKKAKTKKGAMSGQSPMLPYDGDKKMSASGKTKMKKMKKK